MIGEVLVTAGKAQRTNQSEPKAWGSWSTGAGTEFEGTDKASFWQIV